MIPITAFMVLAQQCAPAIAPVTLAAVVQVESGFNPYAIGVVHGRLQRQPVSLAEAIATARALDTAGWNYSAGLAQVNRSNWMRFGMTPETAFDPCRNLTAASAILQECFERARRIHAPAQWALRSGLSCYASGDFSTGYRTGYVQRVVANAMRTDPVVPAVEPRTLPVPAVEATSPGAPATPVRPDVAPPQRWDAQTGHLTGPPGEAAQDSAVVF